MKKYIFTLAVLLSFHSVSAFSDADCGPFALRAAHDGFMHINGVKPDSQKLTFLAEQDDFDNVELQWLVADHRKAQIYAMAYIKRRGEAHLNVQVLRNGEDGRHHIRSYDCVKVK